MLTKQLLTNLIILLPFFALAQKADFRFYTIADGLPQNVVYSVAQDPRDFIWINAGQHLTRFDGEKFLSHSNSSHPVFAQNRHGFSEMLSDGELLVYCVNGQIVSTNTLTGEESAFPLAGYLPAGYDANNGHCFRSANGSLIAVYADETAGKVAVLRLEKGKPTRIVELSGVNAGRNNFFNAIHEDTHGNYFILNQKYDAILKFDPNGRLLRTYPLLDLKNDVIRIFPGRNNSVLFTSGNGIFRIAEGADRFQPHPANPQIPFFHINDLVETPEGNFWASLPGRHILFYDAGQQALTDYHQELATLIPGLPDFQRITLDQSGNLWISGLGGVLRVMPKAALFDTYFTEQNAICPGHCSFRGFAEDGNGSVYASFYYNIFKISSPQDRQSNYTPLLKEEGNPFDLLFYKENLLLNSGLAFDEKTGQRLQSYPNTLHTRDWGVFATDAQGRLWWGAGNKVFLLDEQAGAPRWIEVANLSNSGAIADIAFDPHNGLLWLSVENTLWTLDPGTKQLKRHGENLALYKINGIHPDLKAHRVWLATEKGLVCHDYARGKWQHYAQSEGLANNIAVGILPEGDSCLWVSTYNGLSRLSIQSGRFLNFYKQDGLADNEFNRASHFTASDGRMYFGGIRGVTAFYPKTVMAGFAKQQTGNSLLLRDITLTEDGSDSTFTFVFPNAGDPLNAYHRNRTIRFEFGLLHPGEHSLYSYMLDGLNETWSTPTKDDDLTFNSLPSGKYTFRVKAMDERGNWLPNEIAVPLIVHPPWWASSWAYGCYALLLAGIGYGIFYFLKKRWELRNQLALEQGKAERLKELDSFKSQLFTNITHEFRTPLTVILGMAERLTDDGGRMTEPEAKRGLGLIERNGQNLLRLINQLLDLSKLENKSFQLHLRRGDMVPYLRYVTESFHTYANSRNLSLRFFTTVESLDMDFDPEQVQQMMSNLLSNALKFTPSGGEIFVRFMVDGGRLTVDGPEHGHRPSTVHRPPSTVIQVSDTGIGIPEADLPHIFDRFYQVDGSATRAGEGTGIGLAHTQELVRLMGGDIAVESSTTITEGKGAGSTFTVRLPVRLGSEANGQKIKSFGETGYALPAKKRYDSLQQTNTISSANAFPLGEDPDRPLLLIIEDNPDVVDYLKMLLEPIYQLDIAFNGRFGIEKALETVPDLIISDVMMPEKDGYQVLETLKNDERTSHVPILLLTAKADAASKLAGLRRGADAYLPKPFEKAELLATLSMMLENRRRMATHFAAGFQVSIAAAKVNGQTRLAEEAQVLQTVMPAVSIATEDAFLQKIRDIVAINYADEDFGLSQLCEKIGMSRSQLFRKMKALIEGSPSDYIRSYRMQQAQSLLQTAQYSVKEVAYNVGFKDIPHFSRTFQETFGVPPSAAIK